MFNITRLEQYIEEFMRVGKIPGLALALVSEQQVVFARGFGRTSVEADNSLPVTPQTLFRIGSITKPLTGTLIMRLIEQGRLHLDTPIRQYIDGFALKDQTAAERVTLRMLLNHTSGLPTTYKPFGPRNPEALGEWVHKDLPKLPLVAPPGKVHSYSNYGISLAGYVAEIVAGKFFAQLMDEYVFAPLHMQHSIFDPLVAATYPMALAHTFMHGKTLHVEHVLGDNTTTYPSAFAFSTVLDLANFAIMQMNQGNFQGQRVLTPDSVAEMQRPQADLYTVDNRAYGLTFFSQTYKDVQLVGHSGDFNSFNSQLTMVPDQKFAVVVFSNWFADLDSLCTKVLDDALALPSHVTLPQEVEPERTTWPQYTGAYLSPFGLAKISVRDDQLMLDYNGDVMPLKAFGSHRYFGNKGSSTYSVGLLEEAHGETEYIMLNGRRGRRIQFDTLSQPDPDLWPSYVGSYSSSFETYTLSLHDGRMHIKSEVTKEKSPCQPLDRTRFITFAGVIDLQKVIDGKAMQLWEREDYLFERIS